MNLQTLAAALLVVLVACASATVYHDKIEPFPQPEPATISEKAAIKFKPQLYTSKVVCVSFPAVNAAGEVTGGLKGTNGNDACKYAPKGSQVYGRAGWYKDLWAIMYAWYFPKGFWMGFPTRRHDWKNVVVWIDNPDFETPKIVGVSISKSDTKYVKTTEVSPSNFSGYRVEGRRFHRTYVYGSNTSLRFQYQIDLGAPYMNFAPWDGEYQDLIMWGQLTDAARGALNDSNNFGRAEVPFSDEHFEDQLDNAWPALIAKQGVVRAKFCQVYCNHVIPSDRQLNEYCGHPRSRARNDGRARHSSGAAN